jgi:hypothetical protein
MRDSGTMPLCYGDIGWNVGFATSAFLLHLYSRLSKLDNTLYWLRTLHRKANRLFAQCLQEWLHRSSLTSERMLSYSVPFIQKPHPLMPCFAKCLYPQDAV